MLSNRLTTFAWASLPTTSILIRPSGEVPSEGKLSDRPEGLSELRLSLLMVLS